MPAGRDLVRRLAARVDVVLENFRPGRLDEWGLGYEALRRLNPGIIVVHVSGFGQTGPRAADAGFGSIGEAMGGIRTTTGDPDRPPARCGISLGDALAGLFAVVGTLAAMAERHASGQGQEVDVAIYEAVAALMESTLADFEVAGVTRRRTGGVLPGVAPANAYPTADGSDVLIAGNADSVFTRLCAAMGRPELADDPRFGDHSARGRHMAELDDLIAGWTRHQEINAVLALLSSHGVPAGRVYTPRRHAGRPPLRRPRHGGPSRIPRRLRSSHARSGAEVLSHAGGRRRRGPHAGRTHRSWFSANWPDVGDAEWSSLVEEGTVA